MAASSSATRVRSLRTVSPISEASRKSTTTPSAPTAPDVPDSAEAPWVREPLDAYVLDGLRDVDREPAPAADPRTLVRRLHADLLGLPPAPETVDAFVADPSDAAYDALVDELLASPHHAERLTTFWFDLVRFADTTGIHADNRWNVHPYRDWVIDAFRSNMPFDEFTVRQIAGDLLPDATREDRVAAAYNRLNLATREGGSQPKEFLIRYSADRTRNVAEVWLASSIGCAECHDHKFDPLTTREFYELSAFFADIEQVGVYGKDGPNVYAPEMPVPTAEQAAELDRLERELAAARAEFAADTPELRADFERFEASLGAGWSPLPLRSATRADGTALEVLDDESLVALGSAPDTDRYELRFALPDTPIAALRLEALRDPRLPSQGPGRAQNGNIVLSEIEVTVNGAPLRIASSAASHAQRDYGIAKAHDGKIDRTGWALLDGNRAQAAEAVFELAHRIERGAADAEPELVVRLSFGYGSQHALGRFRITATPAPGAAPLTPDDRASLATPAAERSPEQQTRLKDLHRRTTPLLAATRERIANLEVANQALDRAIPRVLETRSVTPMEVRVRPRGNWMDDSGDVVDPGIPAAFGVPLVADGRPTRLDLARWIVRPEHPLTARVFVNRVWYLLFGRALVASLDDFGVQGAEPVDLALLDHLATGFVASGWDVRALLRRIVRSSAYRQASYGTGRDADPVAADHFGRQSRHRLDAEFVRDHALAVSGLLNPEIGGPSVFPPQPEGYWVHLNFPRRTYRQSEGAANFRRALYNHWQRQYLHPSLLAFDAPSRERCTAKRSRSNTPQAALALLNDPIFVSAARALAARTLREAGPDDAARVTHLWRLALQRRPTATESAAIDEIVTAHRDHYRGAPDAARRLLAVGPAPAADDLEPVEHAAWTSAARVVLNLHESLTRN